MAAYRRFVFKSLAVLVLAFSTHCAWAFLDPPYITPVNPTAGDSIFVNIYGGECDLIDMGIVLPPIAQKGSDISILFTGVHEGDPEWCYYHVGTAKFPLGTFPPGNYAIDVERRYMTIFGTWTQETLGIIPFTVAGTPPKAPVEAPALSNASLAALLAALTSTAWFGLRQRQSR
jgi:hypothetical protein